jgi:site-specific DNA-methyltransferase (adenine-specific)
MKLLTGDSREKLKELEDNSIDALVTDPPYLINFMGKDWDKENSPAADATFWEEVLRVLKPGAHGLVFGHSRQHHRVMIALEDAGFEIRDCLMWLYGQGFPKSHNIGKDAKKLGNDDWDGWGTALKPAYEPIILIRKPVEKKLTIAKNVLKHGTGGLNIDASRIGTDEDFSSVKPRKMMSNQGSVKTDDHDHTASDTWQAAKDKLQNLGRFPANVLLDEVSAQILDEQAPAVGNAFKKTRTKDTSGGTGDSWKTNGKKAGQDNGVYDGLSGASRFFYCAKVSKSERNAGCDGLEIKEHPSVDFRPNHKVKADEGHEGTPFSRFKPERNNHPTVKPIKLMTYLTKLITPPNGLVLDPFMGSGSTGMACALEGFDFVGIEMDPDYAQICEARIQWAREEKKKSE